MTARPRPSRLAAVFRGAATSLAALVVVAACAPLPEPIAAPPVDRVIPAPAADGEGVDPALLTHVLRALHFIAAGYPGAAVPDLRLALIDDPDSAFLHLQLALAWMGSDEPERGREVLGVGLARAPRDPGLNLLVGELAAHDGRFPDAADRLEKASADASLLARAVPALVDALAWNGTGRAVEERAEELASRAPADVALALGLAAALEDHGRLAAALAMYRRARGQRPSDEAAALGEARTLSLLGRDADAADSLVALFEYYPDEVAYFAEIARLLRRSGSDAAAAYREEALRQANGDPQSRLRIAAADLAAGQLDLATALLREVVARSPGYLEARLFLAEVHLARDDGAACLEVLRAIDSSAPSVHRLRAECLAQQGELAAAGHAVEQAARAGDAGAELTNAAGLFARYAVDEARAGAMLRDFVERLSELVTPDDALLAEAVLRDYYGRSEALRLVERLSAYAAGDREVLLRWTDLAARYGKLGESLAVLERLAREEPQNPVLLNALGFTLAEADLRLEQAEVWLRRAHRLAPDEGFISDSLAWLLYRRGDFEAALRLLEEASGASPGDPEILRHLGDVYTALGRDAEARSCYERALALRPPVPLRELVSRRLAGRRP